MFPKTPISSSRTEDLPWESRAPSSQPYRREDDCRPELLVAHSPQRC